MRCESDCSLKQLLVSKSEKLLLMEVDQSQEKNVITYFNFKIIPSMQVSPPSLAFAENFSMPLYGDKDILNKKFKLEFVFFSI